MSRTPSWARPRRLTRGEVIVGTSQPSRQTRKRARQCECGDPGCPAHKGSEWCRRMATEKLFRIDWADAEAPLWFCEPCADDALASGFFAP